MHYYKIKLRLSGSVNNEIWKIVSAPELLLLQFIHDTDAVCNVEEVKNEKIDLFREKNRLKETYNKALNKKEEQSVDKIFGALGTLPTRLPEDHLKRFNIFGEPLAEFDPINQKRIGKEVKNQKKLDNLNKVASSEEVNCADLM